MVVCDITNVSPSLDLFATVGEPVVNFQGGDPLQIGQLLPWNKSHDSRVSACITHTHTHTPEFLPLTQCCSNLFISFWAVFNHRSAPSCCEFLSYLCFYNTRLSCHWWCWNIYKIYKTPCGRCDTDVCKNEIKPRKHSIHNAVVTKEPANITNK